MIAMALRSKLGTNYPVADPNKWVSGDKEGIDPIVLGRLAYYGRTNNVALAVTKGGGYRSHEAQVKMYADYKAGKLQATAAVPGTSWHESRLAADISTYPIRGATSAALAKYGLCKPLKNEPWHIQPIETANMGVRCNMSLAPEEINESEDEEVEQVYNKINEVPAAYQADLKRYIADGVVKGDQAGNLGLTISQIRNLIFTERMIKAYAGK